MHEFILITHLKFLMYTCQYGVEIILQDSHTFTYWEGKCIGKVLGRSSVTGLMENTAVPFHQYTMNSPPGFEVSLSFMSYLSTETLEVYIGLYRR